MAYTLVMLRHGQSTWNLENLFTGWVDVDLTDRGRDEARQGGEDLRARRRAARRAAHVAAGPGDPHRRARARRVRPELAAGAAVVAVERAALRRPAGAEQEGDGRAVRRRHGEGVAPVLRRAAAAARHRRRALGVRRALCGRSPATCCRASECLEGRARTDAAVVVRRHRPRPAHGRDRARRRARQLAAQPREASRGHVAGGGRRAEPPDRRTARVRARRRPATDRRARSGRVCAAGTSIPSAPWPRPTRWRSKPDEPDARVDWRERGRVRACRRSTDCAGSP